MTPRDLFEMLHSDIITRYEILRAAELIEPRYISTFLTDLEDFRVGYANIQFEKANEEKWKDYYSKCDLIGGLLLDGGCDLEWPKEPTPFDIEYADRPPLYDYAVGILTDRLNRFGDTSDCNKSINRPEAVTLPDELATPEGLRIFEQARELGLIDGEYKWLKGLQLLACFAREMSLKLSLGKGCNSNGSPRISWKPFEGLFKIPKGKLRANYNDIQKTGQQPTGHTLIDRIFK